MPTAEQISLSVTVSVIKRDDFMKKENKKLLYVFSVVAGVIILAFLGVLFLKDFLYFYFAPELYTLDKLSSFYAEATEEISSYKKSLFGEEKDFSDKLSFSFWNYKEKENLSFDFSLDYENKKAEFALDNTNAKKLEDVFVYLYDNEIGTNFADFSDDYWVNPAESVISDYNKSILRELHQKEEIKEKNLSFDSLFPKKEKKSAKESFMEFTKNAKLSDKKIDKDGEYIAYFDLSRDYFYEKIYFLKEITEYLGENVKLTLVVSMKDKKITKLDIFSDDKVAFHLLFNDNSGYFSDFEFLAVSPVFPFYMIDIKAQNKVMENGIFNKTDFNYLSDTSENAKSIKFINEITLSDDEAYGKLTLGEKTYNYSGSFYNKDAFSVDITDFDFEGKNIETGIFLTDEFNSVIRKIDRKKELLKMNEEDLKRYVRRSGGEDITRLFE